MKSLKAESLSEDQIIALGDRIKTEHLRDVFDPEYRLEERDEWEEHDMLYAKGPTVLNRDVMSGEDDNGFVLLFVEGDLTIEGSLVIEDDPLSFVVVTGDLLVEQNLLTAGFLEVQGKTQVLGALAGDYNHGGAIFYGEVSAAALIDTGDYQLQFEAGQKIGKTVTDGTVAETVCSKIREGGSCEDVLALIE